MAKSLSRLNRVPDRSPVDRSGDPPGFRGNYFDYWTRVSPPLSVHPLAERSAGLASNLLKPDRPGHRNRLAVKGGILRGLGSTVRSGPAKADPRDSREEPPSRNADETGLVAGESNENLLFEERPKCHLSRLPLLRRPV
jgi:hypothetical protein